MNIDELNALVKRLIENFSSYLNFFNNWARSSRDTIEVKFYENPESSTITKLIIPTLQAIQKNNYIYHTGISNEIREPIIRADIISARHNLLMGLTPLKSSAYNASQISSSHLYAPWLMGNKKNIITQNILNIPIFVQLVAQDASSAIGLASGYDSNYYIDTAHKVFESSSRPLPGTRAIMVTGLRDSFESVPAQTGVQPYIIVPHVPNYQVLPYRIRWSILGEADPKKFPALIYTPANFFFDMGSTTKDAGGKEKVGLLLEPDIDLYKAINAFSSEEIDVGTVSEMISVLVRNNLKNYYMFYAESMMHRYLKAPAPKSKHYSVFYAEYDSPNFARAKLVFDNYKISIQESTPCGEHAYAMATFLPIWVVNYDMILLAEDDSAIGPYAIGALLRGVYGSGSSTKKLFLFGDSTSLFKASIDTPTDSIDDTLKDAAQATGVELEENEYALTGLLFPIDNVFLTMYASPSYYVKLNRIENSAGSTSRDADSWPKFNIRLDNNGSPSFNSPLVLYAPDVMRPSPPPNSEISDGSESTERGFFYTGYHSHVSNFVDDSGNIIAIGEETTGLGYKAIPVSRLPRLITRYAAMSPEGKWRIAKINIKEAVVTKIAQYHNYRFESGPGVGDTRFIRINKAIPIPRNPFKKWDTDTGSIVDFAGNIIDGGHLTIHGSVGVGIYSKNKFLLKDDPGEYVPPDVSAGDSNLTSYQHAIHESEIIKLKEVRFIRYKTLKIPGTWWVSKFHSNVFDFQLEDSGLIDLDVSEAGNGGQKIENVVYGIIMVINGIPILWAPRLKKETFYNVIGYEDKTPEHTYKQFIDKRTLLDQKFGFGKIPIFYNGYTIARDKDITLLGFNKPYESTLFGIGWFFGAAVQLTAGEDTIKVLMPFIWTNEITTDIEELTNINRDDYIDGNMESLLIDFSSPIKLKTTEVDEGSVFVTAEPENNRWKWALILRREIAKHFSNGMLISSPVAIQRTGSGAGDYEEKMRTGYEWIGAFRARVEVKDILSLNFPFDKNSINAANVSVDLISVPEGSDDSPDGGDGLPDELE